MPGWMGNLAAANPVSYAIDALRGAVLGTGTVGETAAAVLAATVLWALVTLWPRNLRRTG
jgi:ABC-2 type transport system permease protein